MSLNLSNVFQNITSGPKAVTDTLNQINRLHKLWTIRETDLAHFEDMKIEFNLFKNSSIFNEKLLPEKISYWNDTYLDRFDASIEINASLENVMQRIEQIFQEIVYVNAHAPCNQSAQGIASGTYLAKYGSTQFVLKLTSKEEFLCHLFVNFILSKLPNKRSLAKNWNLPDAAVVEFLTKKKRNLITSDRECASIPCRIPDWIRTRSVMDPPQMDLMLMEMVSGATLTDFIASGRYDNLPLDKKAELFKTLGSLTAFDLVIGNSDRMLRLYKLYYTREEREETDYDARLLDEQEQSSNFSNFGNLMLNFEGSNLNFYLIDNVLDLDVNWHHLYEYKSETILELLRMQLTLAAEACGEEESKIFVQDICRFEASIAEGFEELLEELVLFIPELLNDREWVAFENWVLSQGSSLRPLFQNLRKFLKSPLCS